VNPKDWTEKVGMQDLKLKNGSSTELFDCQTYLEARFWNFFIHKLSKTVAEGINRGIKGLKGRAFGYRNMDYFILKILQKCGYLNSQYCSHMFK